MKAKIENILYAYDNHKYLPVRVDGKLANKGAYVFYKLSCFVKLQVI